MITVLVTGAGGQLGKCLQKIAEENEEIDWLFMTSSEIDVTSRRSLEECFQSKRIDYCVNCAAYTNVEKAETETQKAFEVNAGAAENLAEVCLKNDTVLIHISTDYVFNGEKNQPYLESDATSPINVYGASKLLGEKEILSRIPSHFIFRTSWLYSQFGHNFYKTILKKADEGAPLNITTAQTGTPTNANDLAACIKQVILDENDNYGIYHFSNEGEATWYDFAKEILEVSGKLDNVQLKEDNSYTTIAKRPAYSVLSKEKLKSRLGYQPKDWKEAVKELYLSQK